MSRGVRRFDTGATRDEEHGKLDFEGSLSPEVLWAFAQYMDSHSILPDGTRREADNWKRGITPDSYMKSLLRHVLDLWLLHLGHEVVRPEDGRHVSFDHAAGGAFFNLQGLWFEHLKNERGGT